VTKITATHHRAAYELGQQVYTGRLTLAAAKEEIRPTGINLNSAADLIATVGRMLRSECYPRRLSVPATASYLAWIERDYGVEYSRRALQAVEQHLEYHEDHTQNNLPREFRHHRSQGSLRALVAEWRKRLEQSIESFVSPEELASSGSFIEGATKTVVVDRYERNPRARRACIARFGPVCAVCAFDFAARYGPVGVGFIHVHHLREIASVGGAYDVDPEKDLRPVCPNCHAMLHRRSPAYAIEELQAMLRDDATAC